MLNLAHSPRFIMNLAHRTVEFHEPSSLLPSPPTAARPGAETGGTELSQRGLGGSTARWGRWRLPGAGQPVRGIRRAGRNLWRGRGGEIRRGPSGPRPQWRIFDPDGEAVGTATVVIVRLDPGDDRSRFPSSLQRLQKSHRLAGGRR